MIDWGHVGSSIDTFRSASLKYWTSAVAENPSPSMTKEDLSWDTSLGVYFEITCSSLQVNTETKFCSFSEKITIAANTTYFDAMSDGLGAWVEYVGGLIDPSKVYFDHASEAPIPFGMQELQTYSNISSPMIADVETNYNFYIDSYEKQTRIKTIPEQVLPNLYAFMFEQEAENLDSDKTEFARINTLQNTIPDVFKDMLNRKGEKIGERDEGQYFEKYAFYLPKARKAGVLSGIRDRYTNIGFPISSVADVGKYNEKAELFPMYMNVSFSTDRTTLLAQSLKDSNMSAALMKSMMESVKNPDSFVDFLSSTETRYQVPSEGGLFEDKVKYINKKEKIKCWDVLSWWEEYSNSSPSAMPSDAIMMSNDKELDICSDSETSTFLKNMMKLVFAGKLRTMIKETNRTFSDLLEGTQAYSETVMYRVDKHLGKTANGPIIQSFYICNSNDIDMFKFVDTQVKYNNFYTYKIYAYQAVFGMEYSYSEPSIAGYTAEFNVNYRPSIKLKEIPYFEETEVMIDDPPIPPDVNIIPYRGISDKIALHLGGNAGEYYMHPVVIRDTDATMFEKVRLAQKRSADETIRFKADDHAAFFQVFRTTKHPTSYKDFSGKQRVTLSTDFDNRSLQKATSATYVDNVSPNIKYYYIFRTVDNHGKISNPSPIYRVEMVDDDGTIYPIIDVVEFTQPIPKQRSKTMRKYLYIAPRLPHTVINEEKSGLSSAASANEAGGQIFLGSKAEAVWDKKFKVRLTSKKTGRKMDINVVFKHEHLTTEADSET